MIALKHLTGWAVQITRADGTKHFAPAALGEVTATFAKNDRKAAVKWKNHILGLNLKARVVPVTYAHPVEIPRS